MIASLKTKIGKIPILYNVLNYMSLKILLIQMRTTSTVLWIKEINIKTRPNKFGP